MNAGAPQLELQLPAEPSSIVTARRFVAVTARQVGIDEEVVEDLKVAISEACTRIIGGEVGRTSALAISITPLTRSMEIEVTGDGGSLEPGDLSGKIGRELVRALFPQADWSESEDGRLRLVFTAGSPA